LGYIKLFLVSCLFSFLAIGMLGVAIVANVLARLLVGLWPHSGESRPPMYGDYEAQRHWMEVTLNLPASRWYYFDLDYWGLDYPPLSAYLALAVGKVAELVEPDMVALDASRGYESPTSKTLMRLSVLFFDLALYCSALLYALFRLNSGSLKCSRSPCRPLARFALVVGLALLTPSLLLIDHGHFQYNSASLGLTLWAIVLIGIDGRTLLGSAAFCCALNVKQMCAYFALGFFSYLLGVSVRRGQWLRSVARVASLGVVVVLSLGVAWAPFLQSPALAAQTLHRLVPIARGLFEDKVANFWCTVSPLVKFHQLLEPHAMLALSGAATLASVLPSLVYCIVFARRQASVRRLLLVLAAQSLGFFMFSYQVHEKSVLLPLLPVTLLMIGRDGDDGLTIREPYAWLHAVGAFSMVPLLAKDKLMVPYAVTQLLFAIGAHLLSKPTTTNRWWPAAQRVSALGMLAIHALAAFTEPPSRLPHLHDLLFTSFAFAHLAVAYVCIHIELFQRDDKAKQV
jgi:alpha-1,3-glucosyltransferase